MRSTKIHDGPIAKIPEGPRRKRDSSWIVLISSSFLFFCPWIFVFAQTPLPPGAVALINEDRHRSLIALCADTGEPVVKRGAKKIRATGVWAGERSKLRRVSAGLGACDPAWSPDGRRLALTSAEGLWVLPAKSFEGSLRVEARLPLGEPMEVHRTVRFRTRSGRPTARWWVCL